MDNYGNMKTSTPAKRTKLPSSLLIAALALICVAVLVFTALMGCQFFRGEYYETRSVEDYGVYQGHIEQEGALFNQFSKAMVFPEELSVSAQVKDYYYACSTAGLDNSYWMLLDYRLPDGEFQAEVNRLQAISVSYGGETKRVAYDSEHFLYPAYVALYTKDKHYEFAMIDEQDNRIIAVLAVGSQGSLDKSLFPQSPIEYDTDIDWYGFSIYHFDAGDGAAVMA